MPGIRSADYDETVAKLILDQIIQDMAKGLAKEPLSELEHEGGGARHEFMMAALDEYKKRGGQIQTHIGGPAEALLKILHQERRLTISLPGAFHTYLAGTALCTTPPERLSPEEATCRRYLDDAQEIERGRGREYRLTIPTDDKVVVERVLSVLDTYAQALYGPAPAQGDQSARREAQKTGRLVLGRIAQARHNTLGTSR
ncbi:hypothetical protein [Actinomadura sp. K4S16]|uniref:hypothetical protein n=1 Tax=Actinomadura sp. K4S16 TaxID=1316147 RepID=UPI0011EF47CB|nr:hypothetical protein [Actinomadura sp. K4S16]